MTKTYKKLYIKSWGCQMNSYDSRRMADVLAPLGYRTVESPEDVDMMILNTCHIREKATDKVFSEIGRLKVHKHRKERAGGKMIMAVAGCVAQAEGDFILKRAKDVDMVFGPQIYHKLPQMVMDVTGERIVNTDFPAESKFDSLPEEHKSAGPAAMISVQEGCDKFCTFCVVPYTRGAEYSRPVAQIMEEAQRLVETGTKELTLLGQNVNAYHGTGKDGHVWGLGRLIGELAEINGLERIRYTTSHPHDMQDELMQAHGEIKELMPYLHLPVQAGSNKILKAMNRTHTADEYREIIANLRKIRPDIAMSSDFIVGFPGESDEDFEQTMQIVREIGYQSAYSFKYSPRPGTPAANMQGLIREDVKTERLARLQDLINEQQLAFNQNTLDMTLPVLFERTGKIDGQLQGRTPYNQSINVTAPKRLLGEIVDVKITKAMGNSLGGDLIQNEEIIVKTA